MSSFTVFLDKVLSLSGIGSDFLALSLDFLASDGDVFLLLLGMTSIVTGVSATIFFRDVVFLAGAAALEGADLGASATTGAGAAGSSFLVTGAAGEGDFSLAGLVAFLVEVLGAGAASGCGSATLALVGVGAFSFTGAGAGATMSSLLEVFN
eukprot:CAMPEP_0170364036 /NCGR_PEP_ID=MMETSP0117_2-20130122/5167_1 /TAXON_ID=400756 /ORGANISM="Durinskia baltica, Strain CSIRO CS-38" /LENGTH=151 /DNA_ID=CAMNT_0010618525 /DNA_START=285 /DNA_END=740 /DNA_ORIENTATION=+